METMIDLLIVGAGPGGMSAATRARAAGLDVVVIDEQPAPGGQIWRNIEAAVQRQNAERLGTAYAAGTDVVAAFRASGARLESNTRVWQIEPPDRNDAKARSAWQVFVSQGSFAKRILARSILLATGAQERPAPFPGWTLPGVMTVGAAQILLKTSEQIPAAPAWVAGCGPLPLLYMNQLLEAGGQIAGWLDTTPAGGLSRAYVHMLSALPAWKDLLKGMSWSRRLARERFPIVRQAARLRALGADKLEKLQYRTDKGEIVTVDASVLLVHEGVIPSVHMTMALGCEHRWDERQHCFTPELDEWGTTSVADIFVAGDGSGIGGAQAACTRGQLAALGVLRAHGRLSDTCAVSQAAPLRRRLRRELAARPMLDAMFAPREEIFNPPNETVVCRCEELTAEKVREAAIIGQPGPNQLKAFTRAGMGPCQGRQCGYSIAHILAAEQHRAVSKVGFQRIRPPLKPLTLQEIASLHEQ